MRLSGRKKIINVSDASRNYLYNWADDYDSHETHAAIQIQIQFCSCTRHRSYSRKTQWLVVVTLDGTDLEYPETL